MKPLVSIVSLTYNHDKYISDALNSFLMQKTNFKYEIIIHDDASTDKTQEIIREYELKYSKIIKPIYQRENQKSRGGGIVTRTALGAACGKYIALCEGDDYWTDQYKLQKQVDFLEANPEYGMVCTNFNRYIEVENKMLNSFFTRYKNEVSYDEYLIDRSSIGTATVMFRADIFNEYEKAVTIDNILKWNVGDTPIWIYFAKFSKIKVFKDITAVYRVRPNSACHFETPKERYEFRKNGFEIPFFFIENFGAAEKTKTQINAKYFRNELLYYSETMQYKESKEAFNKIEDLHETKITDYILLFASVNKITNRLAKIFLSSISKIKNG